jgi:hypothetical protein
MLQHFRRAIHAHRIEAAPPQPRQVVPRAAAYIQQTQPIAALRQTTLQPYVQPFAAVDEAILISILNQFLIKGCEIFRLLRMRRYGEPLLVFRILSHFHFPSSIRV